MKIDLLEWLNVDFHLESYLRGRMGKMSPLARKKSFHNIRSDKMRKPTKY